VAYLSQERKAKEENADKITDEVWETVAKNTTGLAAVTKEDKHLGTYLDPWFGKVTIYQKKGKMYFTSERSPRLNGEVFWYKDQNYVVKWNIRSFHADAHLFFDMDPNGNINHFKMKAISPLTDFSYDFHDLDFTKVE
jgi:hypothetical protein